MLNLLEIPVMFVLEKNSVYMNDNCIKRNVVSLYVDEQNAVMNGTKHSFTKLDVFLAWFRLQFLSR